MKKQVFSLLLGVMLNMFVTVTYPAQDSLRNNFTYYINYLKGLFSPYLSNETTNVLEEKSELKIEQSRFLTSKNLAAIAERAPVAFYDYAHKILTLKKDISDFQATKAEYSHQKSFKEVMRYVFSPSKQYGIINCDTKHTPANRIIGRIASTLQVSARINYLIDTQSLEIVASFDGALVTQLFSPSEKTIILAGTELSGTVGYIKEFLAIDKPGIKGSAKNAQGLPVREESASGEILKYYLFDIGSKSMVASFENIQAIVFIKEDELYVTYDDNTTEKIFIIRNAQRSLPIRLANFLKKKPNISVQVKRIPYETPLKIMYDLARQTIKVTIQNKESKTFEDAISYALSPQNKFLLINTTEKNIAQTYGLPVGFSHTKTTLLDVKSGKELKPFIDTITFEFNRDETRLLRLKRQEKTMVASENQFYQLIDLLSGEIINTFPVNIKAVFFDTSNMLIAIDDQNNKIQYNAITGKTIAEEKRLLQEKQKKEIEEQLNRDAEEHRKKEEQEKKLEHQESQKALEQAEERQKKIEEEEKEWQTAYEQEIQQQPQESFIGWLRSLIPGTKIIEKKEELQQAQEPQIKNEAEKKELLPIVPKQELITESNDNEEEFFDFPENEESFISAEDVSRMQKVTPDNGGAEVTPQEQEGNGNK